MKIYSEWSIPIKHYWSTIKVDERRYEVYIPVLIALVTSLTYWFIDGALPGLLKLRDLLPAALAILIGFTISCITMLASSEASNIQKLKGTSTKIRKIDGAIITLYQLMLILFSYELIIQVFLLLFTFFVAFILRICSNLLLLSLFLFVEVFLIMHIMLLLTRGISYMYLMLYRNISNQD